MRDTIIIEVAADIICKCRVCDSTLEFTVKEHFGDYIVMVDVCKDCLNEETAEIQMGYDT